MNFVTDTHALLWWFTDNPQISTRASEIFEKRRISFNFKRLLKRINDSENFIIIALDYPILQKMVNLKGVVELHDKIIVSTAKYINIPIITKDEILQNLPNIKTIW